jgi:hypothetical protein
LINGARSTVSTNKKEKTMDKGVNLTVSVKVEGTEGFQTEFKWENTDLGTVLLVEKALIGSIAGLLDQQIKGQI